MLELSKDIEGSQARLEIVKDYCEFQESKGHEFTEKELEKLANYILYEVEKEEKHKEIITNNRERTIAKRETSFEQLNTYDGHQTDFVENLVRNDKNIIFTKKYSITKKNLEDSPDLRSLREQIDFWTKKRQGMNRNDYDRYKIKSWIIEMRKDQYVIKSSIAPTMALLTYRPNSRRNISFDGGEYYSTRYNKVMYKNPVSFVNQKFIQLLLQYYSELKQESQEALDQDLWATMMDFDQLIEHTFDMSDKKDRILKFILIHKIDKETNEEIRYGIKKEFDEKYTNEKISLCWRQTIPKRIVERAEKEWLEFHFTNEEIPAYKTCSRCKQTKPMIPYYYSRNSGASCGYYSICKDCRKKEREHGR